MAATKTLLSGGNSNSHNIISSTAGKQRIHRSLSSLSSTSTLQPWSFQRQPQHYQQQQHFLLSSLHHSRRRPTTITKIFGGYATSTHSIRQQSSALPDNGSDSDSDSDEENDRAHAPRDPLEYLELRRIKHLRNVGVLAHVDSGKTTVTERMLALAGVVRHAGCVDDGNTVTDYLPQERERGITIQSAAISLQWGLHNHKKGDDMTQNDQVSIQVRTKRVYRLRSIVWIEFSTHLPFSAVVQLLPLYVHSLSTHLVMLISRWKSIVVLLCLTVPFWF